jgi:dTDP-4-dehydrorhamnose reductase
MNLIIGVSGKIGNYYQKYSRLKNNIYTSRSSISKRVINFDFTKDRISSLFKNYKFRNAVLFSSISDPQKCKKNRTLSNNVNIKYTIKLLDFFIKNNIYFIFFSSEYVYYGKKNTLYNEKLACNPKMIYAKQKIEVENYIKKLKYKNCSVLRLSKTYGDQLGDLTIFSNLVYLYKKQQTLFKIANDQFFKPLFVKDLVKIIDIFLKKKIKGTYNVCGDNYCSRYSLVKNFFKNKNIKNVIIEKCSIRNFDKKIFFPKYLNLDNRKIKKVIKFDFTKIRDGYKSLCINS